MMVRVPPEAIAAAPPDNALPFVTVMSFSVSGPDTLKGTCKLFPSTMVLMLPLPLIVRPAASVMAGRLAVSVMVPEMVILIVSFAVPAAHCPPVVSELAFALLMASLREQCPSAAGVPPSSVFTMIPEMACTGVAPLPSSNVVVSMMANKMEKIRSDILFRDIWFLL